MFHVQGILSQPLAPEDSHPPDEREHQGPQETCSQGDEIWQSASNRSINQYPRPLLQLLSSDGFSASTLNHGVFHDLPMVPGPPVFAKAHRLDADNLASAQAEFIKMEKAGIVVRSSSPWSSPLHMGPKPGT